MTPMTYRRDIDGLRAIAVLSIILFHAGLESFGGGYLGVDVFFVISGFLITGILLRENASGTFTLTKFYERRARRILPALLVVLFVTAAVAYTLMPPMEFRAFAQSATAVLLFSSNILFWQRAGSFDFYFDPPALLNPVLHTWSLGVEEQFYVVFPLLLAFAWRFGRRRAFQMVLAIAVASFACSLILVMGYTRLLSAREADFYLLPPRAWQLMLGAIVAFLAAPVEGPGEEQPPMRTRWRDVTSVVALLLIVVPMVVYRPYLSQPASVYALPPTLGTAILLASVRGSVAGRLLSSAPLVGVGLISYSAYLWHQPLFAFAHMVSLEFEFSSLKTGILVAITLALAWATWRWIETPFRNRVAVSRRTLVTVCGAATVGLLVPALTFSFTRTLPTRGRLVPGGLTQTSRDRVEVMRDCGFVRTAAVPGCALSAASSGAPDFLVVGDSHAAAMLPAFQRLSERLGRPGRMVALAGCEPLLGKVYAQVSPECEPMQNSVLDYVKRTGIKRVFFVSRWAGYTEHAEDQPVFVKALERTIDAYGRVPAQIYIVEQVPQQPYRPVGVYVQALFHRDRTSYIRNVSVTRAAHEARQAFIDSTFARYRSDDRVKFFDPATALCQGEVCPVGTETHSFYWDDTHLSVAGAQFISEALEGGVRSWHW
jgi:peptidoglycan/LPS O-acetylase OafA/YrhL